MRRAALSRAYFPEAGHLHNSRVARSTDAERALAARQVASRATDASEAAHFLSMLGLTATDGLRAPNRIERTA